MKLFFAACARDCSQTLSHNISAILSLSNLNWCDEVHVYIAENNSKDDTRHIIQSLSKHDRRITPLLFANLDAIYPIRESRISYCREKILRAIKNANKQGLYIPIDLDLDLTPVLRRKAFEDACHFISDHKACGLFPSAMPYYYDIHALRAASWSTKDSWAQIKSLNLKGEFFPLLAYIVFISQKQKRSEHLRKRKIIPVESAFGGLGIYSLKEVCAANASYLYNPRNFIPGTCEHVIFNSFLSRLFIKTDLLLDAPKEHIGFKLLPISMKIKKLVDAAAADIKHLTSLLLE